MEKEECDAEIEALESIYMEECSVASRWPPSCTIELQPHTGEDLAQQFVRCTLSLSSTEEYPHVMPAISILRPKGLGDARHHELLEQLRECARDALGTPMLVSLVQLAHTTLTEMNTPEGDCPFCLMPVVEKDGGTARPFMKLMSCFHCAHTGCFAEWWRWEQGELRRQAEEAKAARPALPPGEEYPEDVDEFPVRCPVCRVEVTGADIDHVRGWLGGSRGPGLRVADVPAGGRSASASLEPGLAAALRREEDRRALLMDLQGKRGGIIVKKDLALPVGPPAPPPPQEPVLAGLPDMPPPAAPPRGPPSTVPPAASTAKAGAPPPVVE